LPEYPLALIAEFLLIIVGYPQGILVQGRRIQIVFLELVRSVDDGGNAIDALHYLKPCEYVLLELMEGFVASFLNVENRRQVALEQMYLMQEVFGLLSDVFIGGLEVISTSY